MATEAQRKVFCRLLQQARKEAELSQRELAKQVGVSPGTIAQWEMGETAPREGKVSALEKALDVDDGTFGRLLGFLPMTTAQAAASSVIEALAADSRLSDSDREMLTSIYRQLVRKRRKEASGK